ncbi:MAG TPA: adenine phosphoribosyltransferase, partial [Alphaproteobacteria bacterium]|nr:adenine phosphoribosyltransferase [Alphaproteobacteria bacterium]
MDLQSYIGRIPNYPKPGILFYDISPLLAAP